MVAKNSTVFIIIPIFNRVGFTKRCLCGLANQTYKNIEIIVVDSGSTDGSVEFIQKKYPNVKIIQGNNQWWWTKAMYEGVSYVLGKAKNTDYVLEMNNDCFPGFRYIEQLIKTAKAYPGSIIGSLCVRSQNPNFVVEAGVRIDWTIGLVYGVAQTISNKRSFYNRLKVVDQLDALPGKGTLIPIVVFKKIGNFDVRHLPHYIADYEFTNRAKRLGFRLLVDTHAVLKHFWEATGISASERETRRSYGEAFRLMFSRRSMNNIIDWLNFLFLACPKDHLWRNLYITGWKIAYAVFSVFPLYYIKPIFGPIILFIARAYHATDLLLYRVGLYVTQFWQYHSNWKAKLHHNK